MWMESGGTDFSLHPDEKYKVTRYDREKWDVLSIFGFKMYINWWGTFNVSFPSLFYFLGGAIPGSRRLDPK